MTDDAITDHWIERVTLQNLLALAPAELIAQALEHRFVYASEPAIEAPFAVRASFENTAAPGVAWRGLRVSQPRTVSARVELVVNARQVLSASLSCGCGRPGPSCPHGLALLADIAVSPSLRRAMVGGRGERATLDALPAQRAAAKGEFTVARLVDQWLQLAPRGDLAPWQLVLTVVDGGREGAPRAKEDPGLASLELRLRDPRDRSLFNPQRPRTLTDAEMVLVTLGEPLTRGRMGYAFVGARAAILLHLLRADGRTVVLDEPGDPAVRFSDAPAALRIERARVPRREVVVGADLAAGESVDALVARWSAEGDDAFDAAASEVVLFVGPHPHVFVPARATFYPVARDVDQGVALSMHQRPVMLLPEGRAADAYTRVSEVVGGRRVALPPPERMGLGPRETPEITVWIEGTPLDITVRAEAKYSFGARPLGGAIDPEERVRRDLAREESAVARLDAAGLRPEARAWRAQGDEAAGFWSRGLALLRAQEPFAMSVRVADALRGVAVRGPAKGSVRVSLRGNLLDATLAFRVDDETRVDIARIREALAKKRRWVALDDGTLTEIRAEVSSLVEELDESLRDARADDGSLEGTMPVHQLGRVARWIETGIETRLDASVEGLRARLRAQVVTDEPVVPQGLHASLRP